MVGLITIKLDNTLIIKYLQVSFGGEGGIRTLDTVRYTHFPGVLHRPLGHLSNKARTLYHF